MNAFRVGGGGLAVLVAAACGLAATPALAGTWVKRVDAVCPTGYVPVPAFTLPSGMFVPPFCVMKYEAKKSSYVPGDRAVSGLNAAYAVSSASGLPWVNLTWQDAKVACSAVGGSLIKENQWLSLAHQITSVASNWSGGAVGNGFVYSGHGDRAPLGKLEASVDDNNGYYGTGDAAVAPGDGGFGNYWTSNVPQAYQGQRRTLTLPNGQVIWDLAGNAAEWVDQSILPASRYHGGAGGWRSFNFSENGFPVASNLPLDMKPPGGYNADQGMGRYADGFSTAGANNNVSEAPDNCTGYCAPAAHLRGGVNYAGPFGGIFNLYLEYGRSWTQGDFGFRCTK